MFFYGFFSNFIISLLDFCVADLVSFNYLFIYYYYYYYYFLTSYTVIFKLLIVSQNNYKYCKQSIKNKHLNAVPSCSVNILKYFLFWIYLFILIIISVILIIMNATYTTASFRRIKLWIAFATVP